jgi:hypothetical protein
MLEDHMAETRAGALHPRIEELLELLEETRGALLTAVAEVPAPYREARPADGGWTLGEIVDHVGKVETGTARLLVKRVGEARAQGHASETETSSVFAGFDTRRLRDRSLPIDAPPMVVPRAGASLREGLDALAVSRAALRAVLAEASGLALGTIVHTHPVLGPLNLYQWVIVLAMHDARHAEQVRELGRELSSAGSTG